jgi:hypothetical protein
LTELRRCAEVALKALDAGEIRLAEDLLRALVDAAGSEATGCCSESEP